MLNSETFKAKYISEGYSDYGKNFYAIKRKGLFVKEVTDTFSYTKNASECLIVSCHTTAWALALACDGEIFDYLQYQEDLKSLENIKKRQLIENDDVDYKASFDNLNERFNELAIRYEMERKNHQLHLKELENMKDRFTQLQKMITGITADEIPEYDY